jgi:hypothetical protein
MRDRVLLEVYAAHDEQRDRPDDARAAQHGYPMSGSTVWFHEASSRSLWVLANDATTLRRSCFSSTDTRAHENFPVSGNKNYAAS